MVNLTMMTVGMSVPQSVNENDVRSTVEPVRSDGENAELSHAPDWNEKDTDDSGELVGLSPRDKAGHTNDSTQFQPWWAAVTQNHNRIIDDQVASSGTAAQREVSGEQGHGTMQYTESIDPVIREGAQYGNQYLELDHEDIQDGAGNYMLPTDTDGWNNAVAAQNAQAASRKAYQASLYNAFLNG